MDRQQELVEQLREALSAKTPLAIRGGGSKAFYGHRVDGADYDVSGHEGVVEYDPGELVITCRAGSRLSDMSDLLSENGQHFPSGW